MSPASNRRVDLLRPWTRPDHIGTRYGDVAVARPDSRPYRLPHQGSAAVHPSAGSGPLHAYLAAAVRQGGCESIQVGGTADHVHALVSLGRVRAVAEVVQQMKVESSKWMKARGIAAFRWQAGYGAFSSGASQAEALCRYIQHQEEHHRAATFQDGLRRVLRRYGVAFDERYVWR